MKMNWKALKNEAELDEIKLRSEKRPQVIFKHSTRCGTSSLAKGAYRSISNKVASEFLIEHESPQILVIKNRECVYDESHNGITMSEIIERIKSQ